MSRLTKQIRLVLISSSLVLTGCWRNQDVGPSCQSRPSGDGKQPPPVCGPVDGGRSRSHGGGYHGYGSHFWGWGGSSAGSGTSSGFSGRSGAISGGRGGFGSSGHGVSS